MKSNTILGPSWKPKVAAILTLIGPAGLYFALTSFTKISSDQATSISGGVFAFLTAFGLYVAKQDGVSNSPTPLQVAQPIEQTLTAVASVAHVPEVAQAIAVAQTVEAQVTAPVVQPVTPNSHTF